MRKLILAAATVLAFGVAAQTASATTVSFDFTKAPTSSTGNAFGNTFTYTSGPLTVTAKAYSLLNTSTATTFDAGAMGYFAGAGVGACNVGEGLNCSSPSHQIDNSGRYDFVLLQFSPVIQIASAVLQTYSNAGTDATYYLGNTANPLVLAGKTFGSLSALGFGNPINQNGTGGTNTVVAGSAGGGTFNSLLLAAKLGDSNDAFKIKGLTLTYAVANVPEPATLALLGTGAIGLMALRKRRRG